MKYLYFVGLLSFSISAMAWDCPEWIEEKQSVTQITASISSVKVGIYCAQYEGELLTTQLSEAKWATYYVKIYRSLGPFTYQIGTFGEVLGAAWDHDNVHVIDIPDQDPDTFAIVSSSFSPSNIHIELKAMSGGLLSAGNTDTVVAPITRYQATNREGSESEINGFYAGKEGQVLIDALVLDEKNSGSCSACRKYLVSTLQLDDGRFRVVDRFPYDIAAYVMHILDRSNNSDNSLR